MITNHSVRNTIPSRVKQRDFLAQQADMVQIVRVPKEIWGIFGENYENHFNMTTVVDALTLRLRCVCGRGIHWHALHLYFFGFVMKGLHCKSIFATKVIPKSLEGRTMPWVLALWYTRNVH